MNKKQLSALHALARALEQCNASGVLTHLNDAKTLLGNAVSKVLLEEPQRKQKMKIWTIYFNHNAHVVVQAQDVFQATLRFESEYPDSVIHKIHEGMHTDSVAIENFNSAKYGGGRVRCRNYKTEIHDRRHDNGQVSLRLMNRRGDSPSELFITAVINDIPDTNFEGPCLHIGSNEDDLVMSIYLQDGKFHIFPGHAC